jgi:hypothetical protein
VDGFANLPSELVADIAAALLIGSGALLISLVARRRRLRTFFGIPRRSTIEVIVSGVDLIPGGAVGTEKVTSGSQGTAINYLEYKYALRFATAVESRPSIRVLRTIEPDDWHTAQPVNCNIEIGPSCKDFNARPNEVKEEVRQRIKALECVVVVGGAIYNVVMKYMLEEYGRVEFIRDDSAGGRPRRGVRVRHGANKLHDYYREDPIEAEQVVKPGREYFVVARFVWEKTTIFLCAGTCTAGTVAALRVITSWRTLQRDVGTRPFLRVYEMPLDDATDSEKDPPAPYLIQRVFADPTPPA